MKSLFHPKLDRYHYLLQMSTRILSRFSLLYSHYLLLYFVWELGLVSDIESYVWLMCVSSDFLYLQVPQNYYKSLKGGKVIVDHSLYVVVPQVYMW